MVALGRTRISVPEVSSHIDDESKGGDGAVLLQLAVKKKGCTPTG